MFNHKNRPRKPSLEQRVEFLEKLIPELAMRVEAHGTAWSTKIPNLDLALQLITSEVKKLGTMLRKSIAKPPVKKAEPKAPAKGKSHAPVRKKTKPIPTAKRPTVGVSAKTGKPAVKAAPTPTSDEAKTAA